MRSGLPLLTIFRVIHVFLAGTHSALHSACSHSFHRAPVPMASISPSVRSCLSGSRASPWHRLWARVGEAAGIAAAGMASALWPVLGFVELLALAGVLALQFLGLLNAQAVRIGGLGAVSFAPGMGQVTIAMLQGPQRLASS